MTIRVRQNAPQTLQFTATAEGHELPLAMPQPQGEGPDPHDYFDTALGGCKALTLMVYAQRKGCRWNRWAWTWCAMPARNARVYRLTAKLTLHGELTDAQIDELLAVAENARSTS